MDVGIGLPSAVPGVSRQDLLEWSRRADKAGFSTLGVIDRIVYPNYEPLIALTAAAAVTERIKLTTSILITPYRANTALLAKQAATLDSLSEGRLVLGLAVGGRGDDYAAGGMKMAGRGKRFEKQLEDLKRIWSGEELEGAGAVGPATSTKQGPPLLIGGAVDATFDRAARYADGWIMGGGTPEMLRDAGAKMDRAWAEQGRSGKPRKAALAYYSLGPDGVQNAESYLKDYYRWVGPFADQIAASAATSEETVRNYIAGFSEAGCDELILFPSSTDPDQVDLLAAAAL